MSQVTKIINERGHYYWFYRNNKRIIREYYEQLIPQNLDNLNEMDTFLETHSLPRLTHKDIENLKRPITRKKIEWIIENLPTKKTQGPDSFTGKTC